MHIPKTAGQTLESILLRQYKHSFRFTGNTGPDIQKFANLTPEERSRVVFFYGHSTITTGIEEADHATIITILRHPVSRVKAFCQHVREGKSPYLLEAFPPENFSLDEFLDSNNQELSNLQTKLLINKATDPTPVFDKITASEARDLALENLYTKISHFGLQEYFDHSMILFSSALNWKYPIYKSKNLENPNKLLKFEKHHLEKIAALNKIDIEIYEHAKQQFLIKLDKVPFWKLKLRAYRFVNSSAQFAYKTIKRNSGS